MTVAAVVVCHSLENLGDTLAALEGQTTKPTEVIIASKSAAVLDGHGRSIKLTATTFEDAFAELVGSLKEYDWLWILNAGQVPEASALTELLLTAESSSAAALIAPKIMEPGQVRTIRQYGLTLTPRGSLFDPVRFEFDQAQHDSKQDALGVCLEGVLVSPSKVNAVGGATTSLTDLAADLELSIRLRLRGQRVLLSPAARVVGSDSARFSPRTADHELKIFYYSALKSFFFWLLLPPLVIAEALWLMLRKQPEKIVGELAAGFKVFITVAKLWLARKTLTRKERKNLGSLRSLFATKTEIRDANSQDALSDLEGASAVAARPITHRFFASGAAWVSLALLVFSWQFWPSNVDAAGPALLPLGDSWLSLFTATGSGFQNLGTGFYAPSEPFNWVLLALGSVTFWSPGLALVLLFFLAKSLAFASAFKLLALASNRIWLIILGALAYAFWPAFSFAQTEARIPTVLTHLILPIFAYAMFKLIGAKGTNQAKPVTWGFTALASLAAAVIGTSTPSLVPFLALAWLGFLSYRFRKVGYLIWVPVPLLALWLPSAIFRILNFGNPLTLLVDPALPLGSARLSAAGLLASGWAQNWQISNLTAVAILLALGVTALSRGRKALAAATFLVGFVSLIAAWLMQQIEFVGNPVVGATGALWVNGGVHGLLSVTGLAISLLLVFCLDELKFRRFAALLAYPAVCALAAFALLVPSQIEYTDGRVVPALIRAEAKQNSALKLLVLQPEIDQRYSATLISGDGVHLADLNASYRFALASQDFQAVAQVAADLISASPENLGNRLREQSIGYILVSEPDSETGRALVSNIDSVLGLNSIGTTEFGQLWRVSGIVNLPIEPTTNQDLWSITKGVQLLVLLLFALLAIPTRRKQPVASSSNEEDNFNLGEVDDSV